MCPRGARRLLQRSILLVRVLCGQRARAWPCLEQRAQLPPPQLHYELLGLTGTIFVAACSGDNTVMATIELC